MLAELRAIGIDPPRLYKLGFHHNNCGGFCIKAGQAHFAHLLKVMPERYAEHEAQEDAMRLRLGDVSIMKDRRNKTVATLTLKQLRERIERGESFDRHDWEVTVTDVWLLAKSHPGCVKIEPRISEIKSLLNNGVKVAGVNAVRIQKSGVRLKAVKTVEI